jgi:hypothetical protein
MEAFHRRKLSYWSRVLYSFIHSFISYSSWSKYRHTTP